MLLHCEHWQIMNTAQIFTAKINQLLRGNQFDAQVFALLTSWFVEESRECCYFQDIQFTIINSKTESLKKVQRFKTIQSRKPVRCRKDQSLVLPPPALHLCTQADVYLYHVRTQNRNEIFSCHSNSDTFTKLLVASK